VLRKVVESESAKFGLSLPVANEFCHHAFIKTRLHQTKSFSGSFKSVEVAFIVNSV